MLLRRRQALAMMLAAACSRSPAVSVEPVVESGSLEPTEMTPRDAVRYAASILLPHVPASFDGDKDWGDTKKIVRGLDVSFKNGRLRTHRRYKEVDHGRWIRYEIHLPPSGLRLDESVHIDRVTPSTTVAGGFEMDIRTRTPFEFRVRVQRHVRGLRLSSVTITGHGEIELGITATIAIYSDITEIPPALVIDPSVQKAELQMRRFEVDRISHLGGDAAEAWGEIAQETLLEIAIAKQNKRLVDDLNRTIHRHRDDLRVSSRDLMRRQFPFASSLGSPIQTTAVETRSR